MGIFDMWKFSKAYNKGEAPSSYIKRVGAITAILTFVRFGYEPGVRLCYEMGLSLDQKWQDGGNILHYAVKSCPDEKIVRYLIDLQPLWLNQGDNVGKTPMHYAAVSASVELNQFMYDCGGLPDIKDSEGNLPYYYAIYNRRANHVAAISLDKLQDIGRLDLLKGIDGKLKSAKDAIDNAKSQDESERYINCVQSYLDRIAK